MGCGFDGAVGRASSEGYWVNSPWSSLLMCHRIPDLVRTSEIDTCYLDNKHVYHDVFDLVLPTVQEFLFFQHRWLRGVIL